MGYYKYLSINFLNKRHFYLIKMYSYHKKDIWGDLRVKRLFKYKKVLYSILKRKRRFYNIILYSVYKGVKFMNKTYSYKANLMFTKKRLKLFYGFLRDTYFGKLGLFVKRSMGDVVDYFYSLLERRIDVLVYRSLYSLNIRHSRLFVFKRVLTINDDLFVLDPKTVLKIGEFLTLCARPFNFLFTQLGSNKGIETYKYRRYLYFLVRSIFVNWEDFVPQRELFEYFVPMSFPAHKGFESSLLILIYRFMPRFYKFIVRILREFNKRMKRMNRKMSPKNFKLVKYGAKLISFKKEEALAQKYQQDRKLDEDEDMDVDTSFDEKRKLFLIYNKNRRKKIFFRTKKLDKRNKMKKSKTVRRFFYKKIVSILRMFLLTIRRSKFKISKFFNFVSLKTLGQYLGLKYLLLRRLSFLYKKRKITRSIYKYILVNSNRLLFKIRTFFHNFFLQKKFLKEKLKIKFNIDKVRNIYRFHMSLGRNVYLKSCIEFLAKTLLMLRKIRLLRRFKQFNTYKVYGLANLRIRVRKFYFLIRPNCYSDEISHLYIKRAHLVTIPKRYRYWRFSRNVFKYFRKFKNLYYIYKGYPSYMEVNYKAHMLLLIRNPGVRSVVYPFNFEKDMLFIYFKRKAYF